jgi:hypothetical protein
MTRMFDKFCFAIANEKITFGMEVLKARTPNDEGIFPKQQKREKKNTDNI